MVGLSEQSIPVRDYDYIRVVVKETRWTGTKVSTHGTNHRNDMKTCSTDGRHMQNAA